MHFDMINTSDEKSSRKVSLFYGNTPRALNVQISMHRVGRETGKRKSIDMGFKGIEIGREHRRQLNP